MASINHSVLGIHSSAHPVPVAGGVWASLSPLCSRTLAHRWEFWGIRVCLSLWKTPTFVDVLLANVGCEFLGAEHWGDGIHPSPRQVSALASPNPTLEDSPHPRSWMELWESTSLRIPGSVCSPSPSVGPSAAHRPGWDPGKPKALSFPGISCLPKGWGIPDKGQGGLRQGLGTPRACCPLPSRGF